MNKTFLHLLALLSLSFTAPLTGCATNGDLDNLRQELQGSITDKTAPLEPLRADTKAKFDGVQNDLTRLSHTVNDLQVKIKELNDKSETLVKEREKLQAFLQAANRRILLLFKTEESGLKDRMEFIQTVVKEFEAEMSLKKDEPVKK